MYIHNIIHELFENLIFGIYLRIDIKYEWGDFFTMFKQRAKKNLSLSLAFILHMLDNKCK